MSSKSKVPTNTKKAEKTQKKELKKEVSNPKVEPEKQKEINTDIFFIEDGLFFKELGNKISDKQNIDDFSFIDAQQFPNKVKIRQRDSKWATSTTSNRGNIEGNAGDYLLSDYLGNKLKVLEETFAEAYNKIFGE